jgi:hypothetical protein
MRAQLIRALGANPLILCKEYLMQKKSQKQRKKIQPPVYYEFQKAKGIDGANLAKYYQPNQPHYHLERFNRMELGRLQNTVKREKFDWFITFWGFVGGFIGILKPNRFNLLVILINVIAWWGILIVEFSGSLIRHSPWFLIWLIFLVPFMIENQLHIYWKTRDRIELSKLTERSMFLETRLCSTIVNYIKANIVFILILRWRF